jgi:hypothetical protein
VVTMSHKSRAQLEQALHRASRSEGIWRAKYEKLRDQVEKANIDQAVAVVPAAKGFARFIRWLSSQRVQVDLSPAHIGKQAVHQALNLAAEHRDVFESLTQES